MKWHQSRLIQKHMENRKYIFALFFVMSSLMVRGQDMNFIPFHYIGDYIKSFENMMQQRDGDILTTVYIGLDRGDPQFPPINVGDVFYKVSPSSLTITDSLFVADTAAPYYLFAQDPRGEGNIRANIEYIEESDSTFLRISHFTDDNLIINHDEDIVVPVCEGHAYDQWDGHMVDCWGDLIMKYYKDRPEGGYDCHVVRFDTDGTLKHEAVLPQSQNWIGGMKVYKESPLQYWQWKGIVDANLAIYVIDSLFQLNNTIIINKMLYEDPVEPIQERFVFDNSTCIVPDGDDVLVVGPYTRYEDFIVAETGLAVARYDLRTMQRKNLVKFDEWQGEHAEAWCDGFQKMSDGALYLLYTECMPNYTAEEIAIKIDPDFNVEWKRYCELAGKYNLGAAFCIPTKDSEMNEGMAITGSSIDLKTYQPGIFYFFLNHDGTVGVNDGGIEVRPYCFYPNPTQDMLRMQYSPDVQPARVELFDLQGRLVRTQSKAFESIDMSQLPTGTYTMRITLEDGKTYSDKVVKE